MRSTFEVEKELLTELEKLEELKLLLTYKLITYKEYLAFFKVEFLNIKGA